MRPQTRRDTCPSPTNMFEGDLPGDDLEPCLPCGIPIASLRVIIKALRRVRPGEPADATAGRPAAAAVGHPTRDLALKKPLSQRERQILALLVDGATDKEVADSLGLSRSTVQSHVGAIYQKTGALNRVHLGVVTIQLSLLSSDSLVPGPPMAGPAPGLAR